DGNRHAAGRPVIPLGRGVVADLEDLVPDDPRNVDVGLGGDLARHVHLARGDHGLTSHGAAPAILDPAVADGVTDLAGHLVWMTLGNGFRSKKTTRHVRLSPRLW